MKFKVLDRWGDYPSNTKDTVFLTWDDWNDYSYYTTFGIFYVDEKFQKHKLGAVLLGFKGQRKRDRVFSIGHAFDYIGDDYFSIGASEEYYESLKELPLNTKDDILLNLNDLARNKDKFEEVQYESVVQTSFLRSLSESTITGQFRRIALGGAKLTPYSFEFNQKSLNDSEDVSLSFDVIPASLPPTNVHVIIGRNGVGKTYLINNMIDSLLLKQTDKKIGSFKFGDKDDDKATFSNLVYVSFSAFDELNSRTGKDFKSKGLRYSYIGLWDNTKDLIFIKDTKTLQDDFYKSLCFCKSRALKERWLKAVTDLQSDPNFRDAGIIELINLDNSRKSRLEVINTFKKLSSGHKIILLTITKLIQELNEKSLIVMDEPEAHLHPPLLAAFIRTVSDLLTITNGVAIVATHSPVILQVVPQSCAWKLRRSGETSIAERFSRESFGENIGILTNDIFGLEVTESGFYKLLSEVAKEKRYNYTAVLKAFDEQLGMEARSVLMAIIANKGK